MINSSNPNYIDGTKASAPKQSAAGIKLRTGIVAESSKLFPTLVDEGDALARVLLRSVLLRRRAIGLSGGSNISTAIH
jgi:hypothetical protein